MNKFLKILLSIGILGGVIGGVASAKSPLTEEEITVFSQNNITFYEPCDTSSGSDCGINVTGSTIEEKIWSGLTSFMTDEQAAGVMGNMAHEGGFNPARHETSFLNSAPSFRIRTNTSDSYGIGLIQWSFGRRVKVLNYIKEKAEILLNKYIDMGRKEYGGIGGSDFLSKAGDADTNTLISLELCYLKQELESNTIYGGVLKTTSVQDAADYFLEKVEVPGNIEGTRPTRRADAQKYYDMFHGKTITGSSESSGSSADPACNACAQGSLNINGTAVCLAWPDGTEKNVWKWVGSSYGASNPHHDGGEPTEAFKKAIDLVYPNRGWSLCPHLGASCDVGVGTTVRFSGADKNFPRGLGEQIEYAEKHPELWEIIEAKDASPQAGDVVNNTRSGHHTYIIVQDENGEFYRAESGLCSSFFHISRKFKGFESGARILRSKTAKNSTNGVSVTNGVKSSSTTGTLTSGSGQGNHDISASAFELAWPEGTSAKTYKAKAWDKFVEFFNTLPGRINKGGQTWRDGKSCMVFVSTVLQYAGFKMDRKESSATPDLIASDEWEEINNDNNTLTYSDLQPGDVLSYFGPGSPGDGSTRYKGYGIQHEAIYAETSTGEGRIVEASFEKEWGHVRSRKPNPNSKLGSSWAPIVRIFRWKNQNGGSSCDLCDGEEQDPSSAQLKAGGMNVNEAKSFMKAYHDAAMGKYYKVHSSIEFQGAHIHDAGCPYGVMNNCVAFSQWFINKYTTVGPKWNRTTDGWALVSSLSKTAGLKTGTSPRPYAIFSNKQFSGWGHTGVVLGVDENAKKIVVGEASCSQSAGHLYYEPRVTEYSFDYIKKNGWTFAYTDDVISMGGQLKSV